MLDDSAFTHPSFAHNSHNTPFTDRAYMCVCVCM